MYTMSILEVQEQDSSTQKRKAEERRRRFLSRRRTLETEDFRYMRAPKIAPRLANHLGDSAAILGHIVWTILAEGTKPGLCGEVLHVRSPS